MHGTLTPFPPPRRKRVDPTWTLREIETIREKWPAMSVLRKLLPHRTERAIRDKAKRCGIIPAKEQHIWTGAEQKRLRELARLGTSSRSIAGQLGLRALQVRNRLSYSGVTIARRPPVPSHSPLADVVRKRAFERNISNAELDRSLGRRKIFSRAARRSVGIWHIERAVKALGGRLTIAWEEE
jgi:hypothetical protein